MSEDTVSDNVPKMEEKRETSNPLNLVAHIAVPEKIILCVDLCTEEKTLKDIKYCVELFIKLNTTLNICHEFSLIVLESTTARVAKTFSQARFISNSLSILQPSVVSEDEKFNLDSLFNNIQSLQTKQKFTNNPDHVVRSILILGRSRDNFRTPMKFNSDGSPFTFLDLIWITNGMNDVQFENIVTAFYPSYYEKERNYVFKAEPNKKNIQNCLTQLLAHPLQRVKQNLTNYKI